MNDAELLRALRQISVVDQHRCFGCGYEYRCSLRGCAIINAAIARLKELTAGKGRESTVWRKI